MAGLGLGRIRTDRSANMAAMTALLMPVLIGAAGLTSDTIQWALVRRALQRQVDSAALAGAYALTQGQNVVSTVTADLQKNQNFPLRGTPIIENGPTSGPFAGDTSVVRVRIQSSMRLPFTGLFMKAATVISVGATAGLRSDGDFCILALDTTSSLAITNSGNTTVNANCGMHANSAGEPAINGQGSAVITASPVSAVGNVDNRSNVFTTGTVFQPYSVAQRDPFASLANPTIANSPNNGDVRSNQSRSLTPGTYRGMDIQGTATLTPGTYFIDGRSQGNNQNKNLGFNVGSQAVVSCPTCTAGAGVTIVLTMSSPPASGTSNLVAGMKINAGARISLVAPSTGTYKGVIFFQDRRANTLGETVIINGNALSTLQGAIYIPRNEIRFNGTTGMNINCMQLIGYRLTFSGNSSITNVCPANSGSGSWKGNTVRLLG
jgi:Flp pilus assembly protein TadG